MKTVALIIVFLFVALGPQAIFARDIRDYSQAAITFVEKKFPDTSELLLFATELCDIRLLTRSRVYRVSTAETIPFRSWYVAVDETGNQFVLSYNNLGDFNRFIAKENLKLKERKDYLAFVDLFLTLLTNSESLLEDGSIKDLARIKDEFKNLKIEVKIESDLGSGASLRFFSAGPTGSVKMWEIKISNAGKIYGLKKTELNY